MLNLSQSFNRKPIDASFTVCIRIRPMNEREIQLNNTICFIPTEDDTGVEELDCERGHRVKNWHFDHVFGPDTVNADVFNLVGKPLVDLSLDGFNAVGFLYGQTSSGKTHTLFGKENEKGFVEYALEYMYSALLSSEDTEYIILMSYIELYNEELKDLLSISSNPAALKITDDPSIGPVIQGLTEVKFTNPSDMKSLLQEGEHRRHFGITNMNIHSSRSHVLVRFRIESRRVDKKPLVQIRQNWDGDRPSSISILNLVDLAGSERANRSGTSKESFREGSYINKSLLNLGNVIHLLSEGKKGQHIPYRTSRLTRLLSSALGGNAKTLIVTCISPASDNITETISSLLFSSRAKKVVNQVYKHFILDPKALQQKLMQQQLELDELRVLHQNQIESIEKSLRDRAVSATRSNKQLKYLLKYAPVIVKELKPLLLYEHIYQIKDDIKAVIAGVLDINMAMEFVDSVICTYFSSDHYLIESLDALYEDIDKEYQTLSSDVNSSGEEENMIISVDEVYNGMNLESEELREEIELFGMLNEEIRQVATDKISEFQENIREMMHIHSSVRVQAATEISALRAEIYSLNLVNQENEQVIEEYRRQMGDKDDEIDSLNSQLYTFELEVGNLETRIQEQELKFHEEKTKFNDDIQDIIQRNEDSLKGQIALLVAEMKDLREINAELKLQNENLMINLKLSEEKVAVANESNATLNIDYSNLQSTHSKLINDLEIARHEISQAIQQMEAMNNGILSEKQKKDEEIFVLKQMRDDVTSKLESLENDLKQSTEQVNSVTYQLDVCKSENEILLTRIHDIEEENANLMTLNSKLTNELNALEVSQIYQREKYQEVVIENTALIEDVKRLKFECGDISTSLVLAEKEIRTLEDSLKQYESEFEGTVSNLKLQLQSQDIHCKEIQSMMNKQEALKEALESELRNTAEKLENAEKVSDEKNAIIERLEAERLIFCAENHSLEARLSMSKEDLSQRIIQFNQDLFDIRHDRDKLKKALEDSNDAKKELEKSFKDLKAKYDNDSKDNRSRISGLRGYLSSINSLILSEKSSLQSRNGSDTSPNNNRNETISSSNFSFSSSDALNSKSPKSEPLHFQLSLPHIEPAYSFGASTPTSSNIVGELKSKLLDLMKSMQTSEIEKLDIEVRLSKEQQVRKAMEEKIFALEAIISNLNEKLVEQMRKISGCDTEQHYKIMYESYVTQAKRAKHDAEAARSELEAALKSNSELKEQVQSLSTLTSSLQSEVKSMQELKINQDGRSLDSLYRFKRG